MKLVYSLIIFFEISRVLLWKFFPACNRLNEQLPEHRRSGVLSRFLEQPLI